MRTAIPLFARRIVLSEQEKVVLYWIADGKTNKEIAKLIWRSEATVKSHVESILTKLDTDTRAGAVARALRQGIIE